MATNPYFNNFNYTGEQDLIEDLIIESIQMFGIDTYYLPRTLINVDDIYRESPLQEFNSNVPIEVYIRDVQGFTGDGKFLSKFGLEIRDEITFTIAMRRFREEVTAFSRPREGDLIYLPLNGKVYQIKFVDHEAIFYQMGSLQIWDVVCELYEYSSETFNTGIPAIDDKYNAYSTAHENYVMLTEDGLALATESGRPLTIEWDLDDVDPNSQNDEIQTEADKIIDWTEMDPFSERKRY